MYWSVSVSEIGICYQFEITEAVKFEPCIKVDLSQLTPKTKEKTENNIPSTTTKKESGMKKFMKKLLGSMLTFTLTLGASEGNLQTNAL